MGLFNRLTDTLERKSVERSLYTIQRGVHEKYGYRVDHTPEEYRTYIMTRRGWTPALWEATNFALKRITLPKGHRGFALLALAFVDSQYAQKGLGEKLDKIDKQGPALTSWQDIEWRLCIADTIANDLVRFNNIHFSNTNNK